PGACTYWLRLVGIMQVLKWADVEKVNSLWKKATKGRKTSPPPASSSPALSLGKRQRDPTIIDSPAKKQCIVPEVSCFYPDIDVPLRGNGSVNTLEVIKSAVCTFDQKTIALGSTRSYKCSNHLQVESKCNER
ncbi:12982_t:CDS:2, partial [Funneliformis caledonium]